MGQFKKRGNAKSPITAVITAVITAREYYREAPWKCQSFVGGIIGCKVVELYLVASTFSFSLFKAKERIPVVTS